MIDLRSVLRGAYNGEVSCAANMPEPDGGLRFWLAFLKKVEPCGLFKSTANTSARL